NFSNNSYNGIDLLYSSHIALNNISILNNGYNNGYDGLEAYAVFNGSFTNIICNYNNGDGFEGVDIENCVVSNCIIVNNSDSGINFCKSQNTTFSTNIIANNSFGPYSWKGGFYIEDSNNCTISHNSIFRNKEGGLILFNTNKTFITFNAIYKHDENGISITSKSLRNIIANNIIYNNAYTAIHGDSYLESIIDIDKNSITENDFIANKGENTQVYLYGPSFNVHHNYWDDLQPLDEDEDGIVDNPYLLRWNYDENVGIYDEYPLVRPTNIPTIHYLTTPILLYPRSNFPSEFSDQEFEQEWQEISYNGTVRIQWVDPIDSENHQVTISIFYSRNYEENWTELISGIETPYYDWDTTRLVDGYLQLRIIATCTHGESTMDTDEERIQIDNSPPILTDLRASPFSPIFYIMSGLMIVPISRRIKRNNKDD
ncbi:MAG: right-handed parallel beta-helix repeat-containing protein, partial [Candidatus Heimdallarchaeota archaeon]|nr:right-handed parallel beta-helix repeat-containing protein [Candidatus Heimdallarchaeota archaeon]